MENHKPENQAQPNLKKVRLIIEKSPNGRDGWTLVKPADLPEWVKDPDVIARMVGGEMAMKCDEGEKGSDFYRGWPEDVYRRIAEANDKRARRMARNRRNAAKQTVH